MEFTLRYYQYNDLQGVRAIYGDDEFARPRLLHKYPRMKEYLADEASYYYTQYEPESLFVAEVNGKVVGALLGGVNTHRHEQYYKGRIKSYLAMRCLTGAYGWPLWLPAVIRTELAGRKIDAPQVDHKQYPAHLHIGILPAWRRHGIGTALMSCYSKHLRKKEVAGYHLYASSFHPIGVSFYRKLGLEELGQFDWHLHDGYEWLMVTEYIFGQRLN
jgi:ribosomal protein S18 acetylase RimI-like enzyme